MNADGAASKETPEHPESPQVRIAEETTATTTPAASFLMLERLLKMADSYRSTNALHQAAEMYFELVEKHPETPEAARAEQSLIEMGDNHQRQGELRQARSIFERLLAAQNPR